MNYFKTLSHNPTYIIHSSMGYITIRIAGALYTINIKLREQGELPNTQLGPLEEITRQEVMKQLDEATARMVDIITTASNQALFNKKVIQ